MKISRIFSSMLILFLIGTSIASLAAETVAQATTSPSRAALLAARDYAQIQERLIADCGIDVSPTTLAQQDIYERAKNSKNNLNCLYKEQASYIALSADADSRARTKEVISPLLAAAENQLKDDESKTTFMDLNWGLGFGFSSSSDNAIDDAEIVNGIVRIKSSRKEMPRIVLEFHKFFWLNDHFKDGSQGLGPFVAAATDQGNILSGVGMGLIYGRKINNSDSDGFSIGIGRILDANVKDLASGFKANEAPPTGETVVRYETKARWSTIIFVTRTFE